ncbi:hypothetical protein D6T69_06880 [Tenacibaculum singaporense]|uniref:Uncharacterized protein n=1 Tax=Tenacibaculum singaporense TaxID=2358479 RepID=A0A3Q8RT37_9FLAO|nr:hypothetical protein [Tenacibaculum singaporense]AZJ35256.1 hypothetical protein D6T69_06880 [Tenacibaculum singaporense]
MNPFEVKTPENLKASEIHELFVDVFTDFGQVKEVFHTFLNGPRGSGKSMMFRYMMPDCQILEKGCSLNELDFFSLYVPIKLTDINYPELGRLKDNSNTFINEHFLTTYIAVKCFKDLKSYELEPYVDFFKTFYNEAFLWYVEISGEDVSSYKVELASSEEYLDKMIKILEKMLILCKRYCKSVASHPESKEEYKGALCNYLDFLYPLLLELKKLPFMPQNKPIFLLMDDAGYLNDIQTKILNTWVSYRNSSEVSLKISTQLDYKSYKTVTNKTIDFPHDYSQINIATIYTSSDRKYYNRIESIVRKRIKKYLSKDIEPSAFFPSDEKQNKKIKEFFDKIEEEHTNPDKPYAGKDAARRYATSEYVKYLRKKRSGGTYSYAGFDNLVNISSGVIRYFLEPASRMFSELETQKEGDIQDVSYIPNSIQNEEIVKFSEKFLEDEFKKIFEEHGKLQGGENLSKADKLYNLIEGLGGMFSKIFVSDRTERVVFSVALNDKPDKELQDVIDLAISYGYLHQSSIGNKHGTGRSKLYVLSRTLAPYFKLDPNGFKGYKFMNSSLLKMSLVEPQRFIKETTKYFDTEENSDSVQVSLFDELD